jgi:hypothetical protein
MKNPIVLLTAPLLMTALAALYVCSAITPDG